MKVNNCICGEKPLLNVVKDASIVHIRIDCLKCGNKSRWFNDKKKAITEWNKENL